jgi:hypothetical protein
VVQPAKAKAIPLAAAPAITARRLGADETADLDADLDMIGALGFISVRNSLP